MFLFELYFVYVKCEANVGNQVKQVVGEFYFGQEALSRDDLAFELGVGGGELGLEIGRIRLKRQSSLHNLHAL